jgi:hypothetical protein
MEVLVVVAAFFLMRKRRRRSSGKKRVCQSLLSLAIDLFAQHGIVATRANEGDLRSVSRNGEVKCGTIC